MPADVGIRDDDPWPPTPPDLQHGPVLLAMGKAVLVQPNLGDAWQVAQQRPRPRPWHMAQAPALDHIQGHTQYLREK